METSPENEPLPIKVNDPQLELAWRGLLISVESGYITKKDAVEYLQKWDTEERAGSSEAE